MIRYDSAELVDDNMLLVDVDCPRCGVSRRCEDGCNDVAFYDLTTLLRNIAAAGGLERMFRLGSERGWHAWRRRPGDIPPWAPNIVGWAAP